MILKPYIKAVLFDMAGTTIDDSNSNGSSVLQSFLKAFSKNNINISYDELIKYRGLNKKKAIAEILTAYQPNFIYKVDSIYLDFLAFLEEEINDFKEIEGLKKLLFKLNQMEIRIFLGSGFPQYIIDLIINNLDIKHLIDGAFSFDSFETSRPDPTMIFYILDQLKIKNHELIKIGDSIADIKEGKNANVFTIGVLTGSHTQSDLYNAGADLVLSSISDIL